MGDRSRALDQTVQSQATAPQVDATVITSHEPDQTISAQVDHASRLGATSLADGIRRLGYEFGEELGRGAMGVVSVANQQVFDRPVAVKRLLGDATDRQAALRFFAEALITAQLEHPNIVPIHDLMTNANGQLQLVMKRIAGQLWRELLDDRGGNQVAGPNQQEPKQRATNLTLDDHLDILLKVCDAVSFAHGRGILHRDLKPTNVMVGAYGEVLVMDWGCAVGFGAQEQHPVVPRVEECRHLAGTPSYMAPEMVRVEAERIGPHSDVYQLGAILYEVLTGQKPHRGATVDDVLQDAAEGTILPPAQAAPERDIPSELAEICLAALAKDPATRLRTVAEFANRIKEFRHHAQAVTLVAAARTHLLAARKNHTAAGDSVRKAVAAVEQAHEIWPEWAVANRVLLDALLAYANYHLTTGAYALATTQATQAANLARSLGRKDQLTSANDIVATARTEAAAVAARQRQLRLARRGLIGAAAVLVVGLAGFLAVVSAEQGRTVAALRKAELALAALSNEQAARDRDQKTSAPGLIAQARRAMVDHQWDDAITALRTAITFDEHLLEAHQLLVNVLAAAKRYDDVLAAGRDWQKAANGSPIAARVIAVCQVLRTTSNPVEATQAQLELAELFEEQKFPSLADVTTIPPAKRLEFYRNRINAAWPGAGSGISMRDDGKLVSAEYSANAPGLRERADVVDLEPLRGMPFARLNLDGTGVKRLEPLVGMPLTSLSLDKTQVTDLSPLASLPLNTLSINKTSVSSLSPLRDLPLTTFEGTDVRLNDFSPLAGKKLTTIKLRSSGQDYSFLQGMPLNRCEISGKGDLDLTPLLGAPLTQLNVGSNGHGSIDLAHLPDTITALVIWAAALRHPEQISKFRLKDVQFYTIRTGLDARLLNAESLEILILTYTRLLNPSDLKAPRLKFVRLESIGDTDLAPLAASPVSELDLIDLTPMTWRSLAAFRTSTTLKTIRFGGNAWSPPSFWQRYREDIPGGLSLPGKPLPPITPPTTRAPGLAWSEVKGVANSVDELTNAKVVATGSSSDITLRSGFPDFHGRRYTGYLTVPKDGEYVFTVTSDDGSRLLIGDHVVVDNNKLQAAKAKADRVNLSAGTYPLTVLYFNHQDQSALSVSISGPGLPEQPLPPEWLSH